MMIYYDPVEPVHIALRSPGCKATLRAGDWAGIVKGTLYCDSCTTSFGLRPEQSGILQPVLATFCGGKL